MLYASTFVQACLPILIIASFLTTLVHSQMRPEHGSRTEDVFLGLEKLYAAVFTMEVSLAMVALGRHEFFSHKNNVFDLIIVVICLASLVSDEMPSSVSAFRFLRIARVLRIFGALRRWYNIRILIVSLSNATVPVLYSFLLMGLVLSMFAVVANELFKEVDPANFGDVVRAGFTLFQVHTSSLSVVHVVASLSLYLCTEKR